LRSSTAYKRIRPFRINAGPALSAAPKWVDQASPPDRIQQQRDAVLLLLADEHLHLVPAALLRAETAHLAGDRFQDRQPAYRAIGMATICDDPLTLVPWLSHRPCMRA
jgi:hypothetical protein